MDTYVSCSSCITLMTRTTPGNHHLGSEEDHELSHLRRALYVRTIEHIDRKDKAVAFRYLREGRVTAEANQHQPKHRHDAIGMELHTRALQTNALVSDAHAQAQAVEHICNGTSSGQK